MVEVTCQSTELDKAGRVVDFGVIKQLVGARIDEVLDHATIINPDDVKLREWLIDNCQKWFCMPDPLAEPSAENLAHLIFVWSEELLTPHHVRVVHVRFRETPNGWADYAPKATRVY